MWGCTGIALPILNPPPPPLEGVRWSTLCPSCFDRPERNLAPTVQKAQPGCICTNGVRVPRKFFNLKPSKKTPRNPKHRQEDMIKMTIKEVCCKHTNQTVLACLSWQWCISEHYTEFLSTIHRQSCTKVSITILWAGGQHLHTTDIGPCPQLSDHCSDYTCLCLSPFMK
jgi:hypothetical protein